MVSQLEPIYTEINYCWMLLQRSLATDLQNISMELRKKQSTYLKRLRQQKEVGCTQFLFMQMVLVLHLQVPFMHIVFVLLILFLNFLKKSYPLVRYLPLLLIYSNASEFVLISCLLCRVKMVWTWRWIWVEISLSRMMMISAMWYFVFLCFTPMILKINALPKWWTMVRMETKKMSPEYSWGWKDWQ